MQTSQIDPQVHDLLELDVRSLDSDFVSAPDWVRRVLAGCPWVVVRRAEAPEAQIAIGVRGASRSERWGSFIRKARIRSLVRPSELLAVVKSSASGSGTPPFAALRQLIERWLDLALPWGPVGSLGFELTTGQPVTTSASDLDIVIRAEARISVGLARSLRERSTGLATKVDIRVETPECGFSLEEFASRSTRVLLRYPDGLSLGNDPWHRKQPQVREGVR